VSMHVKPARLVTGIVSSVRTEAAGSLLGRPVSGTSTHSGHVRHAQAAVTSRDRETPFREATARPRSGRGPVIPVSRGKTRITIRLDEDVITWFRTQVEKAGGGNYQSLINDALRQHIAQAREPLEETLRRVVREEIRRAS